MVLQIVSREVISLGSLQMEVFLMNDDTYRLSLTQLTEVLGFDKRRGSDFLSLEVVKSLGTYELQGSGFTAPDSKQKVKTLTVGAVCVICGFYALKDNANAQALMFAALAESIERRADAAFHRARTEQERNDRFESRRLGILSRNFFTNTVKQYMAKHPELSEKYSQHVWSNCTNLVYKRVLGCTAKDFKEKHNLRSTDKPRDFMTADQLREIDYIEKTAAMRSKNSDVEPYQAIKDLLDFIGDSQAA